MITFKCTDVSKSEFDTTSGLFSNSLALFNIYSIQYSISRLLRSLAPISYEQHSSFTRNTATGRNGCMIKYHHYVFLQKAEEEREWKLKHKFLSAIRRNNKKNWAPHQTGKEKGTRSSFENCIVQHEKPKFRFNIFFLYTSFHLTFVWSNFYWSCATGVTFFFSQSGSADCIALLDTTSDVANFWRSIANVHN